jgi:hypothetical protein
MSWLNALGLALRVGSNLWHAARYDADLQKMRDNPLRVFLSHASEDKPRVRKLFVQLNEQIGVKSWLDENDIRPGQEWDSFIQKSLADVQVAILCLSSAALQRLDTESYFRREMEWLVDRAGSEGDGKVLIIPTRLEPCVIPPQVSRWQAANLYELDGYQNLIKLLVSKAKELNMISDMRINAFYNRGDISNLAKQFDVEIRFWEPPRAKVIQWINLGVEIYLDNEKIGNGGWFKGIDFSVKTTTGIHYVRHKFAGAYNLMVNNSLIGMPHDYDVNLELNIPAPGVYKYQFGFDTQTMVSTPVLERVEG